MCRVQCAGGEPNRPIEQELVVVGAQRGVVFIQLFELGLALVVLTQVTHVQRHARVRLIHLHCEGVVNVLHLRVAREVTSGGGGGMEGVQPPPHHVPYQITNDV